MTHRIQNRKKQPSILGRSRLTILGNKGHIGWCEKRDQFLGLFLDIVDAETVERHVESGLDLGGGGVKLENL